jgi:molecular chaperone GrpE (heat shock protein)
MSDTPQPPTPDRDSSGQSNPLAEGDEKPSAEKPVSSASAPADFKTAPTFTLSAADLKLDLMPDRPPSGADANSLHEELADDMLALTKQMAAQEARLAALTASVSQLQATVEGMARAHGMELDQLKEALVSDRKELIGRSTFNALVPAIESLHCIEGMCQGRKGHAPLLQQTQTILNLLTGITRSLGYQSMEVEKGAPFDPKIMECVGLEAGEPGRVLRVDSPGFRAGSVLVRPCRVILGRPQP